MTKTIQMDKKYTSHKHPMQILCIDASGRYPVKALDEFKGFYEFTIEGKSPLSGEGTVHPDGYYDLVEVIEKINNLEPKFKEGTLIKNTKYINLTPIVVESFYWSNEENEFAYKSKGHVWHESECALWEPEEGDFVFLWDNDSEHLVVAKCGFHYMSKRPSILLSNGGTGKGYDNVYPFNSSLPEEFKGF